MPGATAPRAFGIASFLAVLLPITCCADDSARLVVRLEDVGGGLITAYTKYELTDDRVLVITKRRPSGARIEQRRIQLEEARFREYETLLETAGAAQLTGEDTQDSTVRLALSGLEDSAAWRITVETDDGRTVSATVPPRSMHRYFPDLERSRITTGTWRIVEELQKEWN